MHRSEPFALLLAVLCVHCGDDPQQQPRNWQQGIALGTVPDQNPSPSILEVSFDAREAMIEIAPNRTVPLWTYNGTLPGPLLRARRGDRLIVHFTNHLPSPTTIHWHGIRVPNAMDGSDLVQTPVPPGGTFDYEFDLPDAGTYWYHPHIDSSAQVARGLYGALVVEDPTDPATLGEDVVLVLSDLEVRTDNTLVEPDHGGALSAYFGREGNLLLVNGRVRPTLLLREGLPQRWRVINAARTRYQQFSLPGHRMERIASDGGLLEHAKMVEQVTLPPGERVELRVVPSYLGPDAQTIQWTDSNRFHIFEVRPPEPMLELRTFRGVSPAPLYTERLRTIDPLPPTTGTDRMIDLTEGAENGSPVFGINGHSAHHAPPIVAYVNNTERWEIRNITRQDHPFHLHGFFFQVETYGGLPTTTREWRDTINIPANGSVRIAVHYDDRPGPWMFHCHILDHADIGMMGTLELRRR